MRDFVLFDIDHTLSNAFWRDDMIGAVPWEEYHSHARKDEAIEDMAQLARCLVDTGYTLICVTSRNERWRKMTNEWCVNKTIDIEHLLMRPDNDYRPTAQLKLDLVKQFFAGKDIRKEIAFIIDDNREVIAAFAGIGITALHVTARRD